MYLKKKICVKIQYEFPFKLCSECGYMLNKLAPEAGVKQ